MRHLLLWLLFWAAPVQATFISPVTLRGVFDNGTLIALVGWAVDDQHGRIRAVIKADALGRPLVWTQEGGLENKPAVRVAMVAALRNARQERVVAKVRAAVESARQATIQLTITPAELEP